MHNDEEMTIRLLRVLEQDPHISQRRLADKLGISLGKTNYCVRALVDKGVLKVSNFQASNNKTAYAYLLTPKGLEEKTRATMSFLKRKLQEYDDLKEEIERLRQEVSSENSSVD